LHKSKSTYVIAIGVVDGMFLGMQVFDFAQMSPQFCPNPITFAQILPFILPNPNSNQI